MRLCAVLLAAGGGSRYHGPTHKLLAVMPDGVTVAQRSLANVVAAAIGPVVVVTGAVELDVSTPASPSTAGQSVDGPTDAVTIVHNPSWRDGQASSVQVGVAAADALGADAVIIGLADQPDVRPETWLAIASADVTARVVVARYDGVIGPNPVRLARDVWPLLPTSGDRGARDLIAANPQWVTVVDCVGSADDIDTVEDTARWTR